MSSNFSDEQANNNWRIWCVSRFHVNQNIKQNLQRRFALYSDLLYDKYIINERYILEHQNKLNIYDLQNYEFLPNFFNKKIVKFVKF